MTCVAFRSGEVERRREQALLCGAAAWMPTRSRARVPFKSSGCTRALRTPPVGWSRSRVTSAGRGGWLGRSPEPPPEIERDRMQPRRTPFPASFAGAPSRVQPHRRRGPRRVRPSVAWRAGQGRRFPRRGRGRRACAIRRAGRHRSRPCPLAGRGRQDSRPRGRSARYPLPRRSHQAARRRPDRHQGARGAPVQGRTLQGSRSRPRSLATRRHMTYGLSRPFNMAACVACRSSSLEKAR